MNIQYYRALRSNGKTTLAFIAVSDLNCIVVYPPYTHQRPAIGTYDQEYYKKYFKYWEETEEVKRDIFENILKHTYENIQKELLP